VELGLVITIVPGDLRAVDCDLGNFARVSVIQQLAKADVLFLTGACALDNELPEEDKARDHEDPDQNLFDGRIQSLFLIFPVCDPLFGGFKTRLPLAAKAIEKSLHR
jgi:hypothetical protein